MILFKGMPINPGDKVWIEAIVIYSDEGGGGLQVQYPNTGDMPIGRLSVEQKYVKHHIPTPKPITVGCFVVATRLQRGAAGIEGRVNAIHGDKIWLNYRYRNESSRELIHDGIFSLDIFQFEVVEKLS